MIKYFCKIIKLVIKIKPKKLKLKKKKKKNSQMNYIQRFSSYSTLKRRKKII